MIVSITIKNWMSFKDKTFFTMEAGKEKSSRSTLADFKRFRIKLLDRGYFRIKWFRQI